MSIIQDPTYRSSFRKLLDISDKAIRKELQDDYYFISKNRMDNYVHCLEEGAEKLNEQSVEIVKLQHQLQAAHRAGWEQAKREAVEVARSHNGCKSNMSEYIARNIDIMKYKEPTNDKQ